MYVYEVFLSYRRGVIHSQWLVEHFVPLFRDRLREEVAEQCDRDAAELFLDVNEVQAGMSVGNKVVDGLKNARCLVALLSPSYFQSQWCLVEWDSFRMRGDNEQRELVIPTILSQGAKVRRAVGDLMWADFSDYTIIGKGSGKRNATSRSRTRSSGSRGESPRSSPMLRHGRTSECAIRR